MTRLVRRRMPRLRSRAVRMAQRHASRANQQHSAHHRSHSAPPRAVVHVVNNLMGEGLSIHWHGIHQIGTPASDGSVGVAQAPIMPGQNFTYRFQAYPPGTHFWHSHMDALQADKGIKGPIIVHPAVDPFASMYTEDKIVAIADEWREPEICLKLEGALPGNPVCAEIEHASFNGARQAACINKPRTLSSPRVIVGEEGRVRRGG